MREMNLQDLKAQTPAELGTFAEEKAVAATPRPLLFCRFAVGGDETEPKFRSGTGVCESRQTRIHQRFKIEGYVDPRRKWGEKHMRRSMAASGVESAHECQ